MKPLASTQPTPIDPDEYWGRTQLQTLSNCDALVYAYDQLAKGIGNCESEIKLFNASKNYYISESEFDTVLHTYLRDYPHHFWLNNAYNYRTTTKGMYSMLPQYLLTGSALTTARNKFDAAVEEVMQHITTDMTEQERERYIHDYLAEKIVYTGGRTHSHNAYGALVEGLSVCEGYAESFQYLMYQSGILCATVTGDAYSSGSDTPEAHAWSLVRIDGDFYYVDLTWNDQSVGTFYTYYNNTTAEMNRDHILEPLAYDYPLCTATKANYFVVHGGQVNSFSTDDIADEFHKHGNTVQLRITNADLDFWNEFNSNRSAITKKINVIGSATYKAYYIADVYMLILTGQMRGDVNADQRLDQKDLSDLLAHCVGTRLITDATLLKAADVNQDGNVDIRDHQRLYENVKQTRMISPTGEGVPTSSAQKALLTLQPQTVEIPCKDQPQTVVYTLTLTPPTNQEIHSFSATVILPIDVLWNEATLFAEMTDRFDVAMFNGKEILLSGCLSPVTGAMEIGTISIAIQNCASPKEYALSVTNGVCASYTANHKVDYICDSVAVVNPAITDQMAAQTVMAMIDALNPNDTQAITDARAAYNALTDVQQAMVTNLSVLEELENAINQPEPPVPEVFGDVDGNDKTSAADALMILKSVVGKVKLTAEETVKADLDQNGKVDAADALLVLQYVVGNYIPE